MTKFKMCILKAFANNEVNITEMMYIFVFEWVENIRGNRKHWSSAFSPPTPLPTQPSSSGILKTGRRLSSSVSNGQSPTSLVNL